MEEQNAIEVIQSSWNEGRRIIESAMDEAVQSQKLPTADTLQSFAEQRKIVKRQFRLNPVLCNGADPAEVLIWQVEQWPGGICRWQLECVCKAIIESPGVWKALPPKVVEMNQAFDEMRKHDVDSALSNINVDSNHSFVLQAMLKNDLTGPENRWTQDAIIKAALSPDTWINDHRRVFEKLKKLLLIQIGENIQGFYLTKRGVAVAKLLRAKQGAP